MLMQLSSLSSILLLLASTYALDEVDLFEPPPLAPRVTWWAQPPRRPLPCTALPIQEVVIHHTGTEECLTPGECVGRVKHIQVFHMDSLGYDDIAFNFLIGGDGIVYVGRGWHKEGQHVPKDHNRRTLEVAFVGDFTDVLPNSRQMEAFYKLMTMGLNLNLIHPEYILVGQCQLEVSTSPGAALMEFLHSLLHYDQSRPSHCHDLDDNLNPADENIQ